MHPYPSLNRLDRALAWLDAHEPQCAAIVRAHADRIEDFMGLQHYAHRCERVYSADRWCLTGESGVFTDPFYSPGSDFIGVSNELITEMILREREGVDIRRHAAVFNRFYLRLFDAYIKVYERQYPIMGNARVMTAKVAWDNACYWAVTALLYFQRRYRSLPFLESIDQPHAPLLPAARADAGLPARLASRGHVAADARLCQRHRRGRAARAAERPRPPIDDDSLRRKIEENLAWLERFADAIRGLADTTPDPADQRTIIPVLPGAASPGDGAEMLSAGRMA